MREIVSFQLGHCGNEIGVDFWSAIGLEHGVNVEGIWKGQADLQLERIGVYYREGSCRRKFVPRAVGIDLDAKTIEGILSAKSGRVFRPDNFIGVGDGGSNNYGRGFYSDGRDLIDQIMGVSRREIESCDSPQGFQVLHGIGGGVGSGLTGLLLERLKDEFTDKMVMTFSVLPSPKMSDIVVEPYNSVLGLRHLIENAELVFCLDNEALHKSCTLGLHIQKPTFPDLNGIVSNAVTGVTTCLRFPGQLNTGLWKLAVNSVPFPRLHFMIPAFVPLLQRNRKSKIPAQVPVRVKDIIRDMMRPRCRMVDADIRKGKYLTATAIFRGRVSTREVETSLKALRDKNRDKFVDWIPDNAKIAVCDISPNGLQRCATFFTNNTAIAQVWVRILEQFRTMYRRRAYLHWFLGEGMEEHDFDYAEFCLLDAIDEYIPLSARSFGDEEDDEFGEEEEEELHVVWGEVEDDEEPPPPENGEQPEGEPGEEQPPEQPPEQLPEQPQEPNEEQNEVQREEQREEQPEEEGANVSRMKSASEENFNGAYLTAMENKERAEKNYQDALALRSTAGNLASNRRKEAGDEDAEGEGAGEGPEAGKGLGPSPDAQEMYDRAMREKERAEESERKAEELKEEADGLLERAREGGEGGADDVGRMNVTANYRDSEEGEPPLSDVSDSQPPDNDRLLKAAEMSNLQAARMFQQALSMQETADKLYTKAGADAVGGDDDDNDDDDDDDVDDLSESEASFEGRRKTYWVPEKPFGGQVGGKVGGKVNGKIGGKDGGQVRPKQERTVGQKVRRSVGRSGPSGGNLVPSYGRTDEDEDDDDNLSEGEASFEGRRKKYWVPEKPFGGQVGRQDGGRVGGKDGGQVRPKQERTVGQEVRREPGDDRGYHRNDTSYDREERRKGKYDRYDNYSQNASHEGIVYHFEENRIVNYDNKSFNDTTCENVERTHFRDGNEVYHDMGYDNAAPVDRSFVRFYDNGISLETSYHRTDNQARNYGTYDNQSPYDGTYDNETQDYRFYDIQSTDNRSYENKVQDHKACDTQAFRTFYEYDRIYDNEAQDYITYKSKAQYGRSYDRSFVKKAEARDSNPEFRDVFDLGKSKEILFANDKEQWNSWRNHTELNNVKSLSSKDLTDWTRASKENSEDFRDTETPPPKRRKSFVETDGQTDEYYLPRTDGRTGDSFSRDRKERSPDRSFSFEFSTCRSGLSVQKNSRAPSYGRTDRETSSLHRINGSTDFLSFSESSFHRRQSEMETKSLSHLYPPNETSVSRRSRRPSYRRMNGTPISVSSICEERSSVSQISMKQNIRETDFEDLDHQGYGRTDKDFPSDAASNQIDRRMDRLSVSDVSSILNCEPTDGTSKDNGGETDFPKDGQMDGWPGKEGWIETDGWMELDASNDYINGNMEKVKRRNPSGQGEDFDGIEDENDGGVTPDPRDKRTV